MRCLAVRRLISDEIDGRLAPRKRRSFEKHLAACLSCREYGKRLRNLQANSAPTGAPAVPAGYWEGSIARLKEKIETVRSETREREPIRKPAKVVFPRWAWAGAAALIFAGVGLYFVLGPSNKMLDRFPLGHEEAAGRLVAMLGDDEDLEAEFADLIQASILENSGEETEDTRLLLYGDSRFLDGLSEEELLRLETHLDRELKI
jgi:hypothetical protein